MESNKAMLHTSSSGMSGIGWPSPPPSAVGTSRRLARILEQFGDAAFDAQPPPDLQKPEPQGEAPQSQTNSAEETLTARSFGKKKTREKIYSTRRGSADKTRIKLEDIYLSRDDSGRVSPTNDAATPNRRKRGLMHSKTQPFNSNDNTPQSPSMDNGKGKLRAASIEDVSVFASTPRVDKSKSLKLPSRGEQVASRTSTKDSLPSVSSKEGGGSSVTSKASAPSPQKSAKDPILASNDRKSAAARGELCFVHQPPRMREDALKLGDVFFAKLFQGLAGSSAPPAGDSMRGTDAGSNRSAGASGMNLAPAGARKSTRPSDAASFAPNVQARERASCCLENERDALVKDLFACGGRLDRNNLTPPPASAFACAINERLEKMLHQSVTTTAG